MDPPQSKLTLYRGFPCTPQYVWSPFPTKLELFLRLSRIPYTVQAGSATHGPKGKIPYVDLAPLHSDDAGPNLIGDSTLIINHLVEEGRAEDLNAKLDVEQRVCDLGLRALMEEKLYFYHTRERWLENYTTHRDGVLWNFSTPVRWVVGQLIYRNIVSLLHGQGTGRFEEGEIGGFKKEIWRTLDGMLEERRQEKDRGARDDVGGGNGASREKEVFWCLGLDRPTLADCTVFGFITSVLIAESGPKSQAIVRDCRAVMEYARRIHERYFLDYQGW